MKKNLYLSALVLSITFTYSQTPNVSWASKAGGTLPDVSKYIATDAAGNSFITGDFRSSSIAFGATTFTSPGTNGHMYLAKYDPAGSVLWAKNAIGLMNYGLCVATDAAGNVYLAGNFSGSMSMGAFTVNSVGALDIFLAKLDPSGNMVWLKSGGGSSSDFPQSLIADASGNVYMSGKFVNFPLTIGSFSVPNTGQFDIFVCKFDPSGNALWLKAAGGTDVEEATAIGLDNTGNVYIGGYFQSSTLTVGTTTLANVNTGLQDIFFAKYDNGGNVLWAKSYGTNSSETISSIVTTTSGVYVTGEFEASLVIGTNTLISAGSTDMFIAKFDAAGNVVWSKSEGGTNIDYGTSITADNTGNVYVGCNFLSSSITFGNYTYSSAGSNDMSILKYSSSGSFIWSMVFGGNGDDFVNSLSASNTDIYFTGNYASSSLAIGINTFTSSGAEDIFAAKLSNGPTGLSEHNAQSIFSIYPNPTNGRIMMNSDIEGTLEVFDHLGQLIISAPAGEKSFDMSSQPSGIYFIQLKTSNKLLTEKFIKE